MCFGRNLLIFYQGELTQGEPNAFRKKKVLRRKYSYVYQGELTQDELNLYSTVIEGCVIFKHYV